MIITLLPIFVIAIAAKAQINGEYQKLPNGLEYKMIFDKPGRNAVVGDVSEINIVVKVSDSTVFDSKLMNENIPVTQPITEGRMLADLMEGFNIMSEGDKVIFRSSVDSIFPDDNMRPEFINAGELMYWEVEMVSLKSNKDLEAEEKTQLQAEQKLLEKYYKAKNLKAIKTTSGMYVAVTKKGNGEAVGTGKLASMKYTGYLLDGTVFDSNIDPKFNHTDVFKFPVGQGAVIKGWDEGIALLQVGAKATLLIPSSMAYGTRATPGNEENPKGIPANSPLLFDVEVVEVSTIPDMSEDSGGMQPVEDIGENDED